MKHNSLDGVAMALQQGEDIPRQGRGIACDGFTDKLRARIPFQLEVAYSFVAVDQFLHRAGIAAEYGQVTEG